MYTVKVLNGTQTLAADAGWSCTETKCTTEGDTEKDVIDLKKVLNRGASSLGFSELPLNGTVDSTTISAAQSVLQHASSKSPKTLPDDLSWREVLSPQTSVQRKLWLLTANSHNFYLALRDFDWSAAREKTSSKSLLIAGGVVAAIAVLGIGLYAMKSTRG